MVARKNNEQNFRKCNVKNNTHLHIFIQPLCEKPTRQCEVSTVVTLSLDARLPTFQ